MTPTLETLAGLYKAAHQMQSEADFAMSRLRECIARHGYLEEHVREAAGIYPINRPTPSPIQHHTLSPP